MFLRSWRAAHRADRHGQIAIGGIGSIDDASVWYLVGDLLEGGARSL